MSAQSPFASLSATEVRALLLRLRLYAQWKVHGRVSRAVELDPENLALRAIEQTLDGTRRWNRERFDLFQHLSNCIDSYVSHHFEAQARQPTVLAADGSPEVARVPSVDASPEESLSANREVQALTRYIEREHPQFAPLMDMVAKQGLCLTDRSHAARCLGLDPLDSAQMQRAYRAINGFKQAVLSWQRRQRETPR